MSTRIFDRYESEVRGYCRDYPVVFTGAENARLFADNGQSYIDFLGGAGTLNYGHNNPAIKQAVIDYLGTNGVLHGLDMHTTAKRDFIRTFVDDILVPRDMHYKLQFTGPTGTNAVEAALKLARKVTGRDTIMAFTNGYHGMTIGALSCTGNSKSRIGAGMTLQGVSRIPFDGYMGPDGDTIAYITSLLEDSSSGVDLPAAIIMETVQGEGGVNVAGFEWMRQIQALCHRFEIMLIVDDIQVGCGRTGPFFSFDGQGIRPDLICLSKSLSGIGFPMAIVLMKPGLDEWSPGEHNGTFRGNNLAFVSATAAIKTYWQDDTLTREVAAKSEIIRAGFNAIADACPDHGISVSGRGMIYGLHLPVDGMAGDCVGAAFDRNLIIENCGTEGRVLKLLTPLTIPVDELEEGLGIFKKAVCAVATDTPIHAAVAQEVG